MPLLLVTIGGHLVVWRAKHCHDGCVHRYIPTYNSAAAADNRCTSGSHQPVVIERCHRSPDLIDWLIGEPRKQMMAIIGPLPIDSDTAWLCSLSVVCAV